LKSVFDVLQIQRGIDRRHCRIERRAFSQRITFSRFKVWIINPELTSVAHGQAWRIAFHFAPEFVWRLEPNLPGTHERFLHQTDDPLFLKIGLRNPVLTNSSEKIFHFAVWKGRGPGKTHQ
jgi:hypothetical protein